LFYLHSVGNLYKIVFLLISDRLPEDCGSTLAWIRPWTACSSEYIL